MDEKWTYKLDGIFIGIILTTIFFILIATVVPNRADELKQQAIKNGYAQYDPQTGDWMWKCDLDKSKEDNNVNQRNN